MCEVSKILRLAFCCLVCIHMTYDLIMWKYQSVEEKRIEQKYAWSYSAIIIVWTVLELVGEVIKGG